MTQYDVQVGPSDEVEPSEVAITWAVLGSRDAATFQVTDLRRFLWRYGRDITASRNCYRMLVELFLICREHKNVPTEDALRIFRSLPDPMDGETLKKDILGIPTVSPSLLSPISQETLLELLVNTKSRKLFPPEVVAQRFKDIDTLSVVKVARHIDIHYDSLSAWRSQLEDAIVTAANSSTLLEKNLPQRFRMLILRKRADLISPKSMKTLADEEVVELLNVYLLTPIAHMLMVEVVRRDLGSIASRELVERNPSQFFEAALDAIALDEMSRNWRRLLPSFAEDIFTNGWPNSERSWSRIALGIACLEYPRHLGPRAEQWFNILSSIPDDLISHDRIRFQGYLLRTAIDEGSAGSWRLCSIVLPQLRPIILKGELPDDAYRMLSFDLPRFNTADFWDINRRILLSLSYLQMKVSDTKAEHALDLTEEDMQILNNGAAEEERSKRSLFWWM